MTTIWTGNFLKSCKQIWGGLIFSYDDKSPTSGHRYEHLYYPKHISKLYNYSPEGLQNSPVTIPIFISSPNLQALKIPYNTKHIYNIVINVWKNWQWIKHNMVDKLSNTCLLLVLYSESWLMVFLNPLSLGCSRVKLNCNQWPPTIKKIYI